MDYLYTVHVLSGAVAEKPLLSALVSILSALLVAERESLGADYDDAGEDTGSNYTEHVWEQRETKRTQIRVAAYGDGTSFITIGVADEADRARIRDVLSKELTFYTTAELAAKARAATAADARWITLMASSAGGVADPEVQTIIEAHLQSTIRACRREAATAVGLLGWRELVPAVLAARKSEADRGVRAALDFGLMLCQR